MAKPIHAIASTPGGDVLPPVGDLGEELAGAGEALAKFLNLLKVLEDQGVLRLANDFLSSNEALVRFLVDWLSRAENVRTLQNLKVLLSALERVDPDRLEQVVNGLTEGLDRASKVGPPGPRVGVLGLLRQLGEPGANRGLRVLLATLQDFGQDGASAGPGGHERAR
ncbi:MAG: DUF1641 domain-containing protein [Thermoplasmata archaeon]